MSVIREYETLYIVSPDLSEEDQKGVMDSVLETVKKTGAEIIKNDIWGKRKLASSIKKKSEGIYVLVRSKGGPSIPKEVDTLVKRTPQILRQLTTVVTKQQLKEEARLRAAELKRVETARVAAEEAAKRQASAEKAAAEKEAREREEALAQAEAASQATVEAPTESLEASPLAEEMESSPTPVEIESTALESPEVTKEAVGE